MKLILAEIKYYKPVFLAMAMPLIIFTLFGLTDVKVLTKLEFVDKYFWSITIGVGSYLLIYGLQANQLKERRDRLYCSLPVKLKSCSVSRYVFGIFPIVFIAVYLKLMAYIFPPDWQVFIDRAFAQLGLLFIFLAMMSVLFEILKFSSKLSSAAMVIIVLTTFFVIVALSVGLIYGLTNSFIYPLPFGGEELYFYLWAIFLTIISSVIYIKRKSYVV